MLVSTIITNAQSKADIANQNFYSAADALFDAQLAWETIYELLMENDDDYFVNSYYIAPTTKVVGTIVGGGLSTITTTTSLANTGITAGQSITDSAGVVGTTNTIASITLPYTITLTTPASGAAAADTFSIPIFVADSYRNSVYVYPVPTDFFRLRLFQYQGQSQGYFQPCSKMDNLNFAYTQQSPAYRMVGNNIVIYDPYGMSLYNLWYYPAAATLQTTTNLTYPANVLFEFMVWQIAADIRRKQNMAPDIQQGRADELMQKIKKQIHRLAKSLIKNKLFT